MPTQDEEAAARGEEHELQHLKDYLEKVRGCEDPTVGEAKVRHDLGITRAYKCADALAFFPVCPPYSRIIVADAKWQGHEDDLERLPYQLGNAVACVLKKFNVDEQYATIIEPLLFLHELKTPQKKDWARLKASDDKKDKSSWKLFEVAPLSRNANMFWLKGSRSLEKPVFEHIYLRCNLHGFPNETAKVEKLKIRVYVENPTPDLWIHLKALEAVHSAPSGNTQPPGKPSTRP